MQLLHQNIISTFFKKRLFCMYLNELIIKPLNIIILYLFT